jgi:hypothetical protein
VAQALERAAQACVEARQLGAGGTGACRHAWRTWRWPGARRGCDLAWAKGARGSGVRRCGAARPGRARVRQQEEEE